ncbi:hypothetical protein FS837_012472 [Tulasnella sp. UAMH 9824]|nr:hypothetical protein FS837_012472 [Tulasnella sp. UAMH 9824]
MTQSEEEEDGESSPSGESLVECLGGGIPAHHYHGLDHNTDPEVEGPVNSITNADEEEQESMTSDNTGGPDSDQEMTEDGESEPIVEDQVTSGYEADHSESDAALIYAQYQKLLRPRPMLVPHDPSANQRTTQGTNNVLGPLLDSTEDELMGDAAEDSEVEGLINGLSG